VSKLVIELKGNPKLVDIVANAFPLGEGVNKDGLKFNSVLSSGVYNCVFEGSTEVIEKEYKKMRCAWFGKRTLLRMQGVFIDFRKEP